MQMKPKRGPEFQLCQRGWLVKSWWLAVAVQMPLLSLRSLTLSSVYSDTQPWRLSWGAILAINELITLGNGFFFLQLLCRFHLHFLRPVFRFHQPGLAVSGGWGWSCLLVKLPPRYCFWLGLFGLASAAQSWVSFRQLSKVFYFIQGGCIMPISGAIWWELGQKNVPWKWHPICSPMRKDHRISFSLTLLYSFNRV